MEFPHLGEHCAESTCRQLDFLPVKCDYCAKTFCKDHILYIHHNCEASYRKDVQVPVCPLCNQPVPVKRGELPDIRVGEHIDRDCQSDPAKAKRKIYTNRCSVKGCKQRELVKVTCDLCKRNYCLRHRHVQDHDCMSQTLSDVTISKAGAAAISRRQVLQQQNVFHTRSNPMPSNVKVRQGSLQMPATVNEIQAGLSEDEALARAIQMSLMEPAGSTPRTSTIKHSQEEEDRQLAEALALSEREHAQPRQRSQSGDKCSIS